MSLIQILPSALSDQIAAGEVVERPSSVAKELLENALDAGATRITVDFEAGGVQRLRIVDNGMGMTVADAVLSVRRHATSKIANLEDLNNIGTLGFRGEALASIASVSRFRIRTKQKGDLAATLVNVDGGADPQVSEIGGPVGTEVVVEDLFFNVPARRKFLKKKETESTHIVETAQRLALCYPKVAFKVIRDGKTVLDLPMHGDLSERLGGLFPKSITSGVRPISVPGAFGLSGVIGAPEDARGSTRHYYLFVNGRIVKDRVMMSAIQSGCGHLLSKGKHPFAVLSLNLPSQAVDVNVHPAKTEVRFADSRQIFRLIARSVESVLMRKASALESLVASDSGAKVSGLQIKRLVEEQNAATQKTRSSIKSDDTAGTSGLVTQKRRVFDAMARLAQKRHAQGSERGIAPNPELVEPMPLFEQEPQSVNPSEESPQSAPLGSMSHQTDDLRWMDVNSKSKGALHKSAQDLTLIEQQPTSLDVSAPNSDNVDAGHESECAKRYRGIIPIFVRNGLVAFSKAEGLIVVDIALLNKRIYTSRRETASFSLVELESPLLVSRGNGAKIQSLLDHLNECGVRAEPFGETTLRITAVDSSICLGGSQTERLYEGLQGARSLSNVLQIMSSIAASVSTDRWLSVLRQPESDRLAEAVTQVLRSQAQL